MLRRTFRLTLLAAPLIAWGQVPAANARQDADDCYVREVKGLPGSHAYAADFLEVIAGRSERESGESRWGVGADGGPKHGCSGGGAGAVHLESTNGGVTWTTVAQVNSGTSIRRSMRVCGTGWRCCPAGRSL